MSTDPLEIDHKPVTKKNCFVITPIGDPGTAIRRATDGLIAAIRPGLENAFEIHVPHLMSDAGSITAAVIEHILNDDLVIANLTALNPNVMYELAVRHCNQKPIVMLAQVGTKLPFDISDQRTVFYENDLSGMGEIVAALGPAVEMAMSAPNSKNPVASVSKAIVMREATVSETDQYILQRLDTLTNLVERLSGALQWPMGFIAGQPAVPDGTAFTSAWQAVKLSPGPFKVATAPFSTTLRTHDGGTPPPSPHAPPEQ